MLNIMLSLLLMGFNYTPPVVIQPEPLVKIKPGNKPFFKPPKGGFPFKGRRPQPIDP
jgi:hypothetical protein